jgi:hypothetical protein
MQYDDTHYPPRYHTARGGDPDILDHTDRIAAEDHINNPP